MKQMTALRAKFVSVAAATLITALLLLPIILGSKADLVLVITLLVCGIIGFGLTCYTALGRKELIEP